MDFVAAIQGASRTNDVHRPLAYRGNSFEQLIGGIVRGSDGKENFVLRVFKMNQGREIPFQVLFHSFYRTDQRNPRCIKAGRRTQTSPGHLQPLNPLP